MLLAKPSGPRALGGVFTTVYLADGQTPLELADPNVPYVYRDIMVGTKLAIVVSSDVGEHWNGYFWVPWTDADRGDISARDRSEVTRHWEGSHLEAAGEGAWVTCSPSSLGTFAGMANGSDSVPGDWFIIDYTAANVGDCRVGLYEYVVEPCSNCDPFNLPPASKSARRIAIVRLDSHRERS